jgi:hypothetical protein
VIELNDLGGNRKTTFRALMSVLLTLSDKAMLRGDSYHSNT